MIDRSEEIIDQPGEFKFEHEGMTTEEFKLFLQKRKQDVEKRMFGKKITDFYKIGIIVKLKDDNNFYQIVSRFDYSDNQIMFDYKGLICNYDSVKYKYFNHTQIEQAFRLNMNNKKK